jgi:hypothetical protein
VVVPGADHFFHCRLHIPRATGRTRAMNSLEATGLRKSFGAQRWSMA